VAHEAKAGEPLAILTFDFNLSADLSGTLENFEHCSYVFVMAFATQMAIPAGF
jgi:hypothetical protein